MLALVRTATSAHQRCSSRHSLATETATFTYNPSMVFSAFHSKLIESPLMLELRVFVSFSDPVELQPYWAGWMEIASVKYAPDAY